jgi:iron(III) transport system ATP-binding protein
MEERVRAGTATGRSAGIEGGAAGRSPYLRIQRVSKQFGGTFSALTDVSLDIDEGELVCFLGPSGCGKTTLLRTIAGLETLSSGRIYQSGKEVSDLPPSRRDFGIVFQSYALFPNLTVAANVGYGLVSRGVGKREIGSRVDELLRLVGLPESAPKYPAQLSGGQQQRIALARALALSPGLLLLDEPLSALDARVRVHLRGEIRRLHERLRLTTILVTHDQEEALTMADRIVVMNEGRIEQVGTPLEVYRQPTSPFVADFVGTTNFLPGLLTRTARVRFAGVDLECEARLPSSTEGAVTIAIRPEDVVVRNVGTETPNTFEARVTRIEFHGSYCRVRLALDQEESGVLAEFSINAVRDLGIESGKTIRIALPRDRLRVFPAVQQTP